MTLSKSTYNSTNPAMSNFSLDIPPHLEYNAFTKWGNGDRISFLTPELGVDS